MQDIRFRRRSTRLMLTAARTMHAFWMVAVGRRETAKDHSRQNPINPTRAVGGAFRYPSIAVVGRLVGLS